MSILRILFADNCKRFKFENLVKYLIIQYNSDKILQNNVYIKLFTEKLIDKLFFVSINFEKF